MYVDKRLGRDHVRVRSDDEREAMRKQNVMIRELWLEGRSNPEIRERLGVTKGQVSGVIDRTKNNPAYAVAVAARVGVSDGTYNHQVNDLRPKVKELFAKGLADEAIGAEIGVSANATRWYRRKLGLKRRESGGHAQTAYNWGLKAKGAPAPTARVGVQFLPTEKTAPVPRSKIVASAGPARNPTWVCQFPMWPDRTVLQADGTPLFCGVPSRGSWCPTHRDVVFRRCE